MTTREDRLYVWRDENAHPSSPTTWLAMQATGADMSLVEEWRDLEADNPEPMTYADFLEGAIGMHVDWSAEDFRAPADWIAAHIRLSHLWEQLRLIEPSIRRDETGSTTHERLLYARSLEKTDEQKVNEHRERKLEAWTMSAPELRSLAASRDRQEIIRKAAESQPAPDQPQEQPQEKPTIIGIPGEFYARYQSGHVLGFGFMPRGSDAGYFGPSAVYQDGPDPGFDPGTDNSPFWESVREVLYNALDISGEAALAVEWTEDGWKS